MANPRLSFSAPLERPDTRILNFALAVEHFGQAFYSHALGYDFDSDADDVQGNESNPTTTSRLDYDPSVRAIFEKISENKLAHVNVLTSTLEETGAPVIQSCTYSL